MVWSLWGYLDMLRYFLCILYMGTVRLCNCVFEENSKYLCWYSVLKRFPLEISRIVTDEGVQSNVLVTSSRGLYSFIVTTWVLLRLPIFVIFKKKSTWSILTNKR